MSENTSGGNLKADSSSNSLYVMKIQLISFLGGMDPRSRRARVRDIINGSEADLILFPGDTIRDCRDLRVIAPRLVNRDVTAVLELAEGVVMGLPHSLYVYHDGLIEDLFTCQLFAEGGQLKGREGLMEKFFDELPRRQFRIREKRFTVLQCGESAVISGSGEGEFRFKDNGELNERFEKMMGGTDIFLNPIHTYQGHQNKIQKRRSVLSSDGKYYLSTACTSYADQSLRMKSLQYIWHDGKEMTIAPDLHEEDGYVSRIIEI